MQITVDIPDELAASVQASGITPEAYVRNLIEELLRRRAPEPAPRKITMEEFIRGMTAHSDKIPQLPDEAFTRESFYQDHD